MLPGDTYGERNIFKLYASTWRASTPPPYGMTGIVEANTLDQQPWERAQLVRIMQQGRLVD
jgi:hypothetical protein